MEFTRRTVLGSLSAGLILGSAGCNNPLSVDTSVPVSIENRTDTERFISVSIASPADSERGGNVHFLDESNWYDAGEERDFDNQVNYGDVSYDVLAHVYIDGETGDTKEFGIGGRVDEVEILATAADSVDILTHTS